MMDLDLNRLRSRMREIVRDTHKAEADVVNHVAKDVAMWAAHYTAKVPLYEIERLVGSKILAVLASNSLNKKYGRGNWTKAQHQEEQRRIIAAKRRSVGALRAGWAKAIEDYGGTFRGALVRQDGAGRDAKTVKATMLNRIAIIENTMKTYNRLGELFGAGEIGPALYALRVAVKHVADDRDIYAQHVREVLNIHSDK